MKKIMISLLMVAATLNAMAITYSGKVKVRLTSSDNQYCEAVVATSDALNDGLNNSYYAPFNDENKEVHLYVEFGGTRYAHFGSSAATMQNMPLVMKANSATSYTFTFSAMVGTIEIYDKEAGANIDKSQPYIFTIEDDQKNTIIADRFIINYVPAPVYAAEVTTNEDGWASFAYTADVAPADPSLEVYKGALNNSDPENPAIVLTAVTTGIPAGAGVFVHGEPLTTYYFSATTATAFSGNDLVGCTAATDPAALSGVNIYTLRNVGGTTALYHYAGTAAIPAGKAYLPIAVTPSSPAPQRIRMVINGAQGIEDVQGDNVPCTKVIENGQIFIMHKGTKYNVQGQIVK